VSVGRGGSGSRDAGGGDTILAVEDLHVCYGRVEAVSGVSIRAGRGAIVTVLGANGAGKSTLLNALMGVLPISGGRLAFDGRPLAHLPVEARVGAGISLVPEKRELFGTMTVEDNLALGAFRRRGERGAVEGTMRELFARFPRLEERRRQLAGTLSGGERQMLAMARALMSRPKLLMLDEPSLGLAPLIVKDILRIVAELRETGVTTLLVEQNARAALAVADYGYVLENGAVALEGPSAELSADRRVVETYLGVAAAG
jgi:branched-chain amino acid transport system ATP-binding protein